jgi:hypothetical protein
MREKTDGRWSLPGGWAVGWFGCDGLPPLSLGRVNHRQLQRALAHHRDPSLATEFD